MNYSENQIIQIHSKTTFSNGKKGFGEYDYLVPATGFTEQFVFQNTPAKLSILLPAMERVEKFKHTLESLFISIEEAQVDTCIVVLDNSISSNLYTTLLLMMKESKHLPLTRLIYHHDPRMIQSTGRNFALSHLIEPSETLGIWDTDIYCSKYCIDGLFREWRNHPEMKGLAPPLARNKSALGAKNNGQLKDLRGKRASRLKLHMPGEIGEENGIWRGDVLRTTMMRGAYFIRRQMCSDIAEYNPERRPCLRDFAVWQNVPFFLSARELNLDFGYVMQDNLIVFHDEDNTDFLSVSSSLPYRIFETLKSMVLLIYRNRLYNPDLKAQNKRFFNYNLMAIANLFKDENIEPDKIQSLLVEIARLINDVDSGKGLVLAWNDIKKNYFKHIDYLGESIVTLLSSDDIFLRIKEIRAIDLSRPMYTVE